MKFRKKPVVIDAVQFKDSSESLVELSDFAGTDIRVDYSNPDAPVLKVETLEGVMTGQIGDWIIKGVNGEFYPCKPDIFEKTHNQCNGMTFGDAIEALKNGAKVSRTNWNGKGMWIAFTPSSAISNDLARSGATKILANERPGTIVINGHIDMKTADGSIGIGWLASQADMLAEDWIIV